VFLLKKQSIRIYFLCIQNRCRSQIAEAFAQKYAQEHVVIESAGLEASTIHPLTIEVMREVDIDISNRVSKKIDMKKFIVWNGI
jgi:arsenate reductase